MFVSLIFLVVIVIFIFLNLSSKKIRRQSSSKIRKIPEVQNSYYQGQLKARDKDLSTKTINKQLILKITDTYQDELRNII